MPAQTPPLPEGYTDFDCLQHGLDTVSQRSDVDLRTPFQRDVDRILYSSEFRALAGKTQVVASDQLGQYHNRLTHSLKVAQIGKRMAGLLADRAQQTDPDLVGPDPDLVEAAGLLHDIGHPPFGHIGEVEVAATLDELAGGRQTDGFQANAQNLRIATYLSVRLDRGPRGLHLTRALLEAATKYPWHRGTDGVYAGKHWGVYRTEDDAARWLLRRDAHHTATITDPPEQKPAKTSRPVEEQIMDWADEVTYACHDLEDFYRAGLLPLHSVLDGLPPSQTDPRRGVSQEPAYETRRFLEYQQRVKETAYVEEEELAALSRVRNIIGQVFPYEDTQALRGTTSSATSSLLAYFLGKRERGAAGHGISLRPIGESRELTRYGAELVIDSEVAATCSVLNDLIRYYVIDRPGLASQQEGQRRILRDLLTWYANDPTRLLPEARLEEYAEHGDALRAAADTVASLAESQAVRIHRRMSGMDYGQVTDLR